MFLLPLQNSRVMSKHGLVNAQRILLRYEKHSHREDSPASFSIFSPQITLFPSFCCIPGDLGRRSCLECSAARFGPRIWRCPKFRFPPFKLVYPKDLFSLSRWGARIMNPNSIYVSTFDLHYKVARGENE